MAGFNSIWNHIAIHGFKQRAPQVYHDSRPTSDSSSETVLINEGYVCALAYPTKPQGKLPSEKGHSKLLQAVTKSGFGV